MSWTFISNLLLNTCPRQRGGYDVSSSMTRLWQRALGHSRKCSTTSNEPTNNYYSTIMMTISALPFIFICNNVRSGSSAGLLCDAIGSGKECVARTTTQVWWGWENMRISLRVCPRDRLARPPPPLTNTKRGIVY